MAEGSAVAGFAAVVLAGGSARRMGGSDKPSMLVAGRSMRDRVLDALAAADPRVVVGGSADVPAGVRYTRENPPGGGPVAAIAAGLAAIAAGGSGGPAVSAGGPHGPAVSAGGPHGPAVSAGGPHGPKVSPGGPRGPAVFADGPRGPAVSADAPRRPAVTADGPRGPAVASDSRLEAGVPTDALQVAVVAGDLPLLTAEAMTILRSHLSNADGALFVDGAGRRQLLCGVWRVESLRRRLAEMTSDQGGDGVRGASMRALVEPLNVVEVAWVDDGPPPWFDCDTDDDLRRVREWLTTKSAG